MQLPNTHLPHIKMLGMSCSLPLWKKIIQIYLKTLLILEITCGNLFLKHPLDNAATALKKLLYALCKVQKSMSKKLVLYSDSNSSWSFFEKKHLLWDQDEINMTDSTSLLDHELKPWIAIYSLKCDIHKKVTTVLGYCWIWFRKPVLNATITLFFFSTYKLVVSSNFKINWVSIKSLFRIIDMFTVNGKLICN